MKPLKPLLIGIIPLLLLTGCDKSQASAVRLEIARDGSAILTVTSLTVPDGPVGFESACSGVRFEARAALSRARGTVMANDQLVVAGIRFERGPSSLRVRVPRAADRAWSSTLAPTDAADRKEVEQVAGAGGLGATIRIEIRLPFEITSQGFHPAVPGVEASVEKKDATWVCAILLPQDLAQDERDLIWDLAWRTE